VSQPAADAVAGDRRTNCATDDEPGSRGLIGAGRPPVDDQTGGAGTPTVANDGGEVLGPTYPPLGRKHEATRRSGGELGAALAATRGQDRSPGTGAHPQPEAVRLRAPTVVRLVRALAHC
jgi:hypothetical protein